MWRARSLRWPKPHILNVIHIGIGGRWAEKVVYLTQGRTDSTVDIVTTTFVSTKRHGDMNVMGCGFSDEAIVVVKRDAYEDRGDRSEDKTSRK